MVVEQQLVSRRDCTIPLVTGKGQEKLFLRLSMNDILEIHGWLKEHRGLNTDCSCGNVTRKVFQLAVKGLDYAVSCCESCFEMFVSYYLRQETGSEGIRFAGCQHGKCGALADHVVVAKDPRGPRFTLCAFHDFKFKRKAGRTFHDVYEESYIRPVLEKGSLTGGERMLRSHLKKLKGEGDSRIPVTIFFYG